MIKLHHPSGSTATICKMGILNCTCVFFVCVLTLFMAGNPTFGAHVTSFKTDSGKEVLYMSPLAVADGSKGIRGGVPIVFPQFQQPDKNVPKHGFARTVVWKVERDAENDAVTLEQQPSSKVNLILESSEETLAQWPYPFKLKYTVELLGGSSLSCTLVMENTGNQPFNVQALLHNYLAIRDISDSKISGLEGLSFTDQLMGDNAGLQKEAENLITVQKEMDSIYHGVQSAVFLLQPDSTASSHKVKIEPVAFNSTGGNVPTDVVMWNPWINKSKSISDMEDDGYKTFVCIEPGLVRSPVSVSAGKSIALGQTINA